jgi:hypothetical protein
MPNIAGNLTADFADRTHDLRSKEKDFTAKCATDAKEIGMARIRKTIGNP